MLATWLWRWPEKCIDGTLSIQKGRRQEGREVLVKGKEMTKEAIDT